MGPYHPLAEQIAGDRRTLENIMRQLDVEPSGTRVAVARVAELLGRLKPNGRLFERSPLSKVVELETLVVGIRGKEALWASLQTAELRLQGIDLQALAQSAKTQAREVDKLRLSAVATAFGERPVPPAPRNREQTRSVV